MRKRILLAFIVWTVCTAAARAQSGPDNDADTAPGYVNSVFHHGQVDSINLYNGQLTIPISLGPSYPVGPKLKFQAVLTYNSRKSDYGHPTNLPISFTSPSWATRRSGRAGSSRWERSSCAGRATPAVSATSDPTEASTCSIMAPRPAMGPSCISRAPGPSTCGTGTGTTMSSA